jgi:subtilisin family serine protease
MGEIKRASRTTPVVAVTDRTVLVFADDVTGEQLEQFKAQIGGLFDGEKGEGMAERTVIIPPLRVIVTPVTYEVFSSQLRTLDRFGVIAHAPERVSFVPRRKVAGSARRASPSTPLDSMGVIASSRTGKDIGVAMLDTGFDGSHVDFLGRRIILTNSDSSIPTSPWGGHGTHTTGLACGPRGPARGVPRYGVATDSTIISVRVFDEWGQTTDCDLLRGMVVALANGAQVIAICLAGGVALHSSYNSAFEAAAAKVAKSAVLIAAAGDDPAGDVYPVCHPANCPSIMAVAGLDSRLRPSDFSCGQRNPDGEVNLSAPGEHVLSSLPGDRHGVKSGTSMSAAYAAGIAALWAETGLRGPDLRSALESHCSPLAASSSLVGNGLVKAPA